MSLFKRSGAAIIASFWLLLCYSYILWWTVRTTVRRAVKGSIIVVLLIASVILFLEFLAAIFGKKIEGIELPGWAQLLILALALIMVLHRFGEWREFREESVFAKTIVNLFEEIALLDFTSPDQEVNRRNLSQFVNKALAAFLDVFKTKRHPRLNVMLTNAKGALTIAFFVPDNDPYPDGISFAPGFGGAGLALARAHAIYFPATRYRHGISVIGGEYDLMDSVYEPLPEEEFKSVICAPIRVRKAAVGVLNIDSRKQNAFNFNDLDIAQVAAGVLGLAFDRYGKSLYTGSS